MIASVYEVRECPECSGSNLSYLEERDQVVCRDCGLVYEPLTPSEDKKLLKGTAAKKPAAAKKPKDARKGSSAKKPAVKMKGASKPRKRR